MIISVIVLISVLIALNGLFNIINPSNEYKLAVAKEKERIENNKIKVSSMESKISLPITSSIVGLRMENNNLN